MGKNKFSVLDDPKEKKVDLPKVDKRIYDLEDILGLTGEFLEYYNNHHMTYPDKYRFAQELVKDIDYDLEGLSQYMTDINVFKHELYFHDTGLFLSALINEKITDDDEIFIDATDLEKPLNHIGIFQKKGKITYLGETGDGTGRNGMGGEFILKGSARNYCGQHRVGGRIEVHGNINQWGFSFMEGGKVAFYGDAENGCCAHNAGAEVYIYGNVTDLFCWGMEGGEVKLVGNYSKGDPGEHMTGGVIDLYGNYPDERPNKFQGDVIKHKGRVLFNKIPK